MSVHLQNTSISRLQLTQFIRLRFVRIDRKTLVHEEIPDLFSLLPGVERFVLRVTDAAKLFVRSRRFGPVALANELDDPFALIDLLTQHLAQIAPFGSKDVLPDRLVPQESEGVGHELSGTAQLFADRGNENRGTW